MGENGQPGIADRVSNRGTSKSGGTSGNEDHGVDQRLVVANAAAACIGADRNKQVARGWNAIIVGTQHAASHVRMMCLNLYSDFTPMPPPACLRTRLISGSSPDTPAGSET